MELWTRIDLYLLLLMVRRRRNETGEYATHAK